MRKNVDQLEKEFQARIAKREEIEQAIAANKTEIESLEKKALAVAEIGSIEEYKAIKAKQRDIEDSIFVQTKHLEKLNDSLDPEEVKAAWDLYEADYEKKLDKGMAEVNAIIKQLSGAFKKCVDLQNDALKTRVRCGEFVGITSPDYSYFSGDPYADFRIKTIPKQVTRVDVSSLRYGRYNDLPKPALFLMAEEASEDAIYFFNSVLGLHRPV